MYLLFIRNLLFYCTSVYTVKQFNENEILKWERDAVEGVWI